MSGDAIIETITNREIYERLCKIAHENEKREMLITPIPDQYGEPSTVFFSLIGSPPKGYAVLISLQASIQYVVFYDMGMYRRGSITGVYLDKKEIEEMAHNGIPYMLMNDVMTQKISKGGVF